VEIAIFDVLGRRLRILADGPFAAGSHRLRWDGHDAGGAEVASGTYFYRLNSEDHSLSRPMTLLR
jgi:flagellar hook assembly protein FlgD